MTFLYVLLLFLVICACAVLTLLGLPGNWAIIVVTLLFATLVPPEAGLAIGIPVFIGMLALALLGELLEFFLSAAGLARGASKRGAMLALVGSVFGSFIGAVMFSVVPIIGTIVGLLLGGALGAMTGAVIGEKSLGKDTQESLRLGKIAFWGRLFGSLIKIFIAGLLVAIAMVAAIV
jgi:uncharacterized protein